MMCKICPTVFSFIKILIVINYWEQIKIKLSCLLSKLVICGCRLWCCYQEGRVRWLQKARTVEKLLSNRLKKNPQIYTKFLNMWRL